MKLGIKTFLASCTLWLVCVIGAFAQDAIKPIQPSLDPEVIAVQSYGEHDKLCSAWTDGCVTCTLGICSNIGIACQPEKITCTSRFLVSTRNHMAPTEDRDEGTSK